jgi:UDP-hydrolysing UDP-N-acetyl-D-glucosamine 2-epimerase
MKQSKKILVALVDRANYGRLRPLMREFKKNSFYKLQILCTGSMLLEKYGNSYKIVQKNGFKIDSKVFMELEGSNIVTMSTSFGLGIINYTNELNRLKPDFVLVIGDRYEALAIAIATSFANIPLIHLQGGETSGSIDESIRHAITKFADLHFPATDRAKRFIIKMGEFKNSVFNYGCPSSDEILKTKKSKLDFVNKIGIGATIDFKKKYILIILHSNTKEYKEQSQQIQNFLSFVKNNKIQTIWLWPNIDAGADTISKELRIFREKYNPNWIRFIKNLSPEEFQGVLSNASCAIGNSSSFVRDSAFYGVPVLLIGNRQSGRETAKNVTHLSFNKKKIEKKLLIEINKKYRPEYIYGKGGVSKKIAKKIKNFKFLKQKSLSYF